MVSFGVILLALFSYLPRQQYARDDVGVVVDGDVFGVGVVMKS